MKHFLRDGWNDIKGSNQKPHRVLLDEEEVEKQRAEILKARDDAEKLKEEHEKVGQADEDGPDERGQLGEHLGAGGRTC